MELSFLHPAHLHPFCAPWSNDHLPTQRYVEVVEPLNGSFERKESEQNTSGSVRQALTGPNAERTLNLEEET